MKECSNEWSCVGSCWNEKNEKSDLMERDDETDLVSQQQSSFNTRLHKRLVKPNHVHITNAIELFSDFILNIRKQLNY